MENLVTAYLYQYKFCPLKKLGTLLIQTSSAQLSLVERSIQAPRHEIVFNEDETLAVDFIQFISLKKAVSNWEAENLLSEFCKKIQQLGNNSTFSLPHAGKFIKTDDGRIQFKQEPLPESFSVAIPAELVVRPNSEHTVKVGDRETTNTVMAAFFAEKKKGTVRYWVYWAIGLALAGILAIAYYFYGFGATENFGNINSVKTPESSKTYISKP